MCGCRMVLWRWRTSGREVAETEVGKESTVKGMGAVETGKVGSKDTGGGGYHTGKGKEGKNCVGSR